MQVTIIQLRLSETEPPRSRFERVRKLLKLVHDADLVLLPELWQTGFCSFDRYAEAAEPIDGKTASAMAQAARDLEAYVLAGSIVEREHDKLYNTSLLFAPTGELVGRYRKIHLFRFQSREAEILTPGTEIVVVPTELARLGMSTCYDLRFPELYRRQLDQGAEVFLVSAAWPYPRLDDWALLVRARALENLCFLIAANCSGENAGCTFIGRSCVVDPWGQVIAGAGDSEAVIRAEIDLATVSRRRSTFPAVDDRVLR